MSSVSKAPVVREISQKSQKWLEERGIPHARLDAELLLAHTLACKRLDLFMHPDRPLTEDELATYRALIQRRAQNEPIAYITGSVGFWKHEFLIDRRALIPRPETEGILDAVLKAAGNKRDAPLRIVDVGTGSGALAISLALEFPQATVVAIDLSSEALALAKENAEQLGVSDRVHFIEGDVLDRLVQKGSKADIIVSNPPYISEGERHLMSAGVEEWEPRLALFAPEEGFGVIDKLLAQLPQVLDQGGLFVMEFGSPQGEGIRARAQKKFRQWAVLKDYSGHDRLLLVHAPGERAWAEIAPLREAAAAEPELEAEAWDAADLEGDEDSFQLQDALRYGGADGTETLPEIDIHEDFD